MQSYLKKPTTTTTTTTTTNRIVNIWNSLPNHVVSADSVNTFKSR